MTIEEAKQWAESELAAATARVGRLREDGSAYKTALESVERLIVLLDQLSFIECRATVAAPDSTHAGIPKPAEPLHEVTPEPVSEDSSGEDRSGKSTTKPDEPIPDIADVREKMAAYKAVGVDIKAILTEFGLKNLSAAEPGQYNAILAKAAEAREALG